MDSLPRVKLSGALEGDYVVLAQRASGSLLIAPLLNEGKAPMLVALRRTSGAAPAQWEGELEDGRSLYVHYRRGQLNVGVGKDRDEAIGNSFPGKTLLSKELGCELEGTMDFLELRAQLYGLLDFPEKLAVEGERKPNTKKIDAETSGEQITEILDAIPGAWERTQEGLEQVRRGEGVPLDDLI